MRKHGALVTILALTLVALACAPPGPEPTMPTASGPPAPNAVTEYAVTAIPLSGPVADRNAEVSGLAWYGDHLIILPQYPNFFGAEGDGALFSLSRADILTCLDGSAAAALEPIPIPFVAPGLAAAIDGFEGYEAIAFAGDQAFLTIEASSGGGMKGYLVSGRIAPDLSALTLDTTVLAEIEPQAQADKPAGNKSDEALLVAGDRLVTLYETNGAGINPSPVAHRFDTSLAPAGTLPFPHVEYRITDATALDADNRFWAINYFFPGEPDLLPETDPLVERYGQGPTHARSEPVERLVEFQYDEAGIRLADTPPIQLELLPDDARNWEGLVRLDGRGFLLMTDKFPQTILGFVPLPDG